MSSSYLLTGTGITIGFLLAFSGSPKLGAAIVAGSSYITDLMMESGDNKKATILELAKCIKAKERCPHP